MNQQPAHHNEHPSGANLRWMGFTLLAGGIIHTVACWLALQLDFFRGTPTIFYQLFAIIWIGNLLLLVGGVLGPWRRHLTDGFVGVVLCWSTLGVLVSAFFVDQIRLCIMVFFFAILQAGVFRVGNRLLIGLSVFAMSGYGVILLVVHLLYPEMVDWSTELVQWLAFSVVAVGAMFLVVDITTLRRAVTVRNKQLAAIVSRIENMAMHDELTGLYNRRHVMSRLEKLRELAIRDGLVMQIAYLDLDHFKRINDKYGHAFGDEVLKRFGALLKEQFSGRNFAARIGGEEFLLVLVNMSEDEAVDRLETLRESWQATRYPDHPDVVVTVSAGLAAFRHKESQTEWLARADAALYQAKLLGRNRVCQTGSEQREGSYD